MNRPIKMLLAIAACAIGATQRPASVRADLYFGEETTNTIYQMDTVSGSFGPFVPWTAPTNDTPFGMTILSGTMYAADKGGSHFVKITGGSPPTVTNLASVLYPHDVIALPGSATGDFIVASSTYGASAGYTGPGYAPMYRFKSDGTAVGPIADTYPVDGATGLAYSVIDSDRIALFVASSRSNSIFKFTYRLSTNTVARAATIFPYFSSEIDQPADLAIGADGNLLVAGWGNDTVAVVDPLDGTILSTLTAPPTGFDGPAGFAIDGNDLYISNSFNSKIFRYVYSGAGYTYDRTYDLAPGMKPLFMTVGTVNNVVPEPGGLALLAIGLSGLAARTWRNRSRRK